MPERVHVGLGSASSAGACRTSACGSSAQLVLARVDEHRPRERGVVRVVGDDAHGDPMRRVGAGEGIDDVEGQAADVRDDLLAQPLEVLLGDLRVDVAPPDPLAEAVLADDELVLGRTAGVLARSPTASGPPSVITPSPRRSAWLYSCEVVGFQYTSPASSIPWAARPVAGSAIAIAEGMLGGREGW